MLRMPIQHRILSYLPAVALVLPFVLGSLALLAICSTYGVWSFRGWRVYQAMEKECHPVWRDYYSGRIRAGDPVEDVIAQTNPAKVERRGRGVILDYSTGPGSMTGLTAIAHDGRLVFSAASSCSWVRLFFDEMTEEQSQEFFRRSKDDPRRLGLAPVYR